MYDLEIRNLLCNNPELQNILDNNPDIKEIFDAGERRARMMNGRLVIDKRKLAVFLESRLDKILIIS